MCSGPLRVSPTAVRTATPSAPVATSQPPCGPRSSFAGSARSGTATLPPAGTVTSRRPTATPSGSAAPLSRLRSSTASRRVCAAPCRWCTSRSARPPRRRWTSGRSRRWPSAYTCWRERPGHVDPAAALLEDGQRRVRLGGADQRVLELRGRPVRVLLGEDRRRAGHVRRGHRGAGRRGVARRPPACPWRCRRRGRRRCRRPGAVISGLSAVVAEPRAAAGEVGQAVVAVHRADGQRRVGRARARRRSRAAPVVAGGDRRTARRSRRSGR